MSDATGRAGSETVQELLAREVEDSLTSAPGLVEMQQWGFVIAVSGDRSGLTAQAASPNRTHLPIFKAQIAAGSWWSSADSQHAVRLASRLEAELRMKWERWAMGGE